MTGEVVEGCCDELNETEARENTMGSRRTRRREPVTRGTGNVFADLGFTDAASRQAKLRLAYALNQILQDRHLTQDATGRLLGLSQPEVSALKKYKLAEISFERLMTS